MTYSAASRIDFSWTWYEKMKNASDEFTLNKLIKMKDNYPLLHWAKMLNQLITVHSS